MARATTPKEPILEEEVQEVEKVEKAAPVKDVAPQDPEELVEYTAPLTTPDAKPIFVGVNGETVRIQRGVPVKIKRKFYEALMHAQEQELAAFVAQRQAQEASTKSLADM